MSSTRTLYIIILATSCEPTSQVDEGHVEFIIRSIFLYREYPKIGNCPAMPACIILHMDRRKKGSFLFLGFPCRCTACMLLIVSVSLDNCPIPLHILQFARQNSLYPTSFSKVIHSVPTPVILIGSMKDARHNELIQGTLENRKLPSPCQPILFYI